MHGIGKVYRSLLPLVVEHVSKVGEHERAHYRIFLVEKGKRPPLPLPLVLHPAVLKPDLTIGFGVKVCGGIRGRKKNK